MAADLLLIWAHAKPINSTSHSMNNPSVLNEMSVLLFKAVKPSNIFKKKKLQETALNNIIIFKLSKVAKISDILKEKWQISAMLSGESRKEMKPKATL